MYAAAVTDVVVCNDKYLFLALTRVRAVLGRAPCYLVPLSGERNSCARAQKRTQKNLRDRRY